MILQKNKKKVIVIVAMLLLIFFHYTGIIKPVEDVIYNLLTPISSSIYSANNSISNKYTEFKKRKEVNELYKKCVADNKQIEIYNTQIQLLEQENKKLQEIVNFTSNTTKHFITTKAIGRNTDNLSKMIIIDVGEKNGIKVGQPVVASGNILVGTIIKTQNNISFVRLINDNQSKIAATMINEDESLGIVEGGYGLSLRMTLIPREEIIILGDKVVTSGLQENIPAGILIGDVAVAENEAYQPFQQAILNPATDLSKLDIVSVITQK